MSSGKETMCETMFFFSVQVCLDPWTVQRPADLRIYLFLGGKGRFLCFYVKKIVLVDGWLGVPPGTTQKSTAQKCNILLSIKNTHCRGPMGIVKYGHVN